MKPKTAIKFLRGLRYFTLSLSYFSTVWAYYLLKMHEPLLCGMVLSSAVLGFYMCGVYKDDEDAYQIQVFMEQEFSL